MSAALLAGLLFAGQGAVSGPRHGTPCGYAVTACNTSVTAGSGSYRGLIGVSGDSRWFGLAAHSGTQPACGDCVWTIVLGCPKNDATNPNVETSCQQAISNPQCAKGDTSTRVYLSTDAESYVDEGVLCLGPSHRIVDVTDEAAALRANYIKDVTPPPMTVTLDPRTPLAGLAELGRATPPATIRPQSFSGAGVTETITIKPTVVQWHWGDGSTTTANPGQQTRHTYSRGGKAKLSEITTWGASYTVTYDGVTAGPYPASGTVQNAAHQQVRIATSRPVIVS